MKGSILKASGVPNAARAAAKKYALAQVARLLGHRPGLRMKFAQLLALFGDLGLTENIARELFSTPSSPRPWRTEELHTWLERCHKRPIAEVYSHIHPTPAASASIAQVFRATLKQDSSPVALKLLYPDVLQSITDQTKLIQQLSKLINLVFPGQDGLENLIAYFQNSLKKECDFAHELSMQKLAKETLFSDLDKVLVPKVYPHYSSRELLVSSWIEGYGLEEATKRPQKIRECWADSILRMHFRGLFRHHWIHGDIHPGNVLFKDTGELALLDYGAAKLLPKTFCQNYDDFTQAIEREDRNRFEFCARDLGLKSQQKDLGPHFDFYCKAYAPLFSPTAKKIKHNQHLRAQAKALLKQVPLKGRSIPRPEYIILEKTQLGLLHLLECLDAPVPIGKIRREEQLLAKKNFH